MKLAEIKIGYIGLGGRGQCLLEHIVLPQGELVTAVCDKVCIHGIWFWIVLDVLDRIT